MGQKQNFNLRMKASIGNANESALVIDFDIILWKKYVYYWIYQFFSNK